MSSFDKTQPYSTTTSDDGGLYFQQGGATYKSTPPYDLVTSISHYDGPVSPSPLSASEWAQMQALVSGAGLLRPISAARTLAGGAVGGHLGASITNGSGSSNAGVYSWSALLSNGLPVKKAARGSRIVSAHPGENAEYIATQMSTLETCDYLVVGPDIGTNGMDLTQAEWVAAIESIISTASAWGVPIIFCLTIPRASSEAAQYHVETRRRNTYLLLNVAKRGYAVIDTYSPLLDRATGYLSATYDSDGVHPNDAGHAVIANLLIAYVTGILPDVAAPIGAPGVSGTPALGLLANPLMAGTSGSIPTSWSIGTVAGTWSGTTLTLEDPAADADLPQGKWFRIQSTCTADGSRRYQASTPVDAVSVQPGDKLLLLGRSMNAGAGTVGWRLLNPTTSLFLLSMPNAGTDSTETRQIYTVPAGVTRVVLLLEMTGTTGQAMDAYMGMADIINTTRQSIAA